MWLFFGVLLVVGGNPLTGRFLFSQEFLILFNYYRNCFPVDSSPSIYFDFLVCLR